MRLEFLIVSNSELQGDRGWPVWKKKGPKKCAKWIQWYFTTERISKQSSYSWMKTKVDPWNRKRVRTVTNETFSFRRLFFNFSQTRKANLVQHSGLNTNRKKFFWIKTFSNYSRPCEWIPCRLMAWKLRGKNILNTFPAECSQKNRPYKTSTNRAQRCPGVGKADWCFSYNFRYFCLLLFWVAEPNWLCPRVEEKRNPLQGFWRWMVAASFGWYGPLRMSCRALPFWEGLRKRLPKAEFIAAQAFQCHRHRLLIALAGTKVEKMQFSNDKIMIFGAIKWAIIGSLTLVTVLPGRCYHGYVRSVQIGV